MEGSGGGRTTLRAVSTGPMISSQSDGTVPARCRVVASLAEAEAAVADGGPRSALVVDVRVIGSLDAPARATIRAVVGSGFEPRAVVEPGPLPTGELADEARQGREIALVLTLVEQGVRYFAGVDPARLRRIVAVAALLDRELSPPADAVTDPQPRPEHP